MILRYIYCGKLSLKECDTLDIVKILIAASELSPHELIPHLQFFLIENKVDWMIQNFSLIYKPSFENESFLELRKFCIKLISKEPEKIFDSPDFTSISEKSLISIIQNDNVQMSIVQIWEYALKWGIAQIPNFH
ncbi:BTB/POZ protein [Rhizophagus irregularis DAOM 181602=DAOM 197198]|nr:BTB/POZ protein [Rhizophagus irregularis DAOM 181602=DAOM 197198]